MSTRTIAYMCNWCNDIFKSRTIADRHEETCLKNPDCVNCLVCVHQHHRVGEDALKDGWVCSLRNKLTNRIMALDCENFERV